MAERCPPSRCEIHLEKTITDGIRWAANLEASEACGDKAEAVRKHYEQAREAMEQCSMRRAFDHLQQGDMMRQRLLRCLDLQEEANGTAGLGGRWEIRKLKRRRRG